MKRSWQDSIHQQRGELARMLREPLGQLAERCAPEWGDCDALDAVLVENFSSIPHCSILYCVGMDGIQICNNVGRKGIVPEHLGRDRSRRPYMQEAVPVWGFLLSDAYISLKAHRPSLTALQVVNRDSRTVGYLG
ncbi:MAG: hypothetical protein Q8K35_08405, partial [Thiobacillus sp.]|nr:hypothetical protein [Thiobacillus sp.]